MKNHDVHHALVRLFNICMSNMDWTIIRLDNPYKISCGRIISSYYLLHFLSKDFIWLLGNYFPIYKLDLSIFPN